MSLVAKPARLLKNFSSLSFRGAEGGLELTREESRKYFICGVRFLASLGMTVSLVFFSNLPETEKMNGAVRYLAPD